MDTFFFLPLPSCSGWSLRSGVGFKVSTSHPYTGPPNCEKGLSVSHDISALYPFTMK